MPASADRSFFEVATKTLFKKLTIGAAAVLLAALSIATAAMSSPAVAKELELRGAGSTFSAPLYETWIEAFERAHPEIVVRYAAVGSGEGIAQFRAGVVDFGASDVPLSTDEISKIERGVIQAPSTAGMIVLAYNLPGVAQLKLPQDVYVDILSWPHQDLGRPENSSREPRRCLAGKEHSCDRPAGFEWHDLRLH